MLKFTDTMVTFREVPDEISLCVNISNCPIHCPACHSKELWDDIGEFLTEEKIDTLIEENKGCTTFVISGGDGNPEEVNNVAKYIKKNSSLLVCWYSGRNTIAPEIELENFDFIKLGPYIEERGGLDNPNTNQKFYEVVTSNSVDETGNVIYGLEDITYKFWKNGLENNG